MISVIIPANNEAKVIGVTLKKLKPCITAGDVEVIVVCNGCSDNTAEVVASYGKLVKCIITKTPSKTNALNLGDRVATGYPRFYLDADVVLSQEALREVATVLQKSSFLAAAPRMQIDTRKSSWVVSAYYEVWQKLPYVAEGMIGTGVYALAKKGRQRFDLFPQIIADDGYIRALFTNRERISVDSAHSLVRAPLNLEGLLKIKTRSRLGRQELSKKFPELLINEEKKYLKTLFNLIFHIKLWPKICVYLYVNLYTRLLANRHNKLSGFTGWKRDDSSRNLD